MSRPMLRFQAGGESPSPGDRIEENGLEDNMEDGQDLEDDDDDLEDDIDAARLEKFMRDRRRTQSLPAYPDDLLSAENSHRKRVSFADSMGLNLASVKHFSALEDPQIPSKVLSRHKSFPPPRLQQPPELPNGMCQGFKSTGGLDRLDTAATDRLVACFAPPQDADVRVKKMRVCLEEVTVTQFDVRGQILAEFCAADKEVGVRYTFNDWLSHVDAQAIPVHAQHQPQCPSDLVAVGERFTFTIYTPPFMEPNSAVHFAVYVRSAEGEFWDNNVCENYTLRYRCVPGTKAFETAAFHAT